MTKKHIAPLALFLMFVVFGIANATSTTTPVVLTTTPPESGWLSGHKRVIVDVIDVASTNSNTDVLASAVTPAYASGQLYLQIQVATQSTVKLRVAHTGNTTKSLLLNGGTALTAGALYRLGPFDCAYGSGITYNLQLGADSAIDRLTVSETDGP